LHIPDGFLEARVWVPAWVVAVGAVAVCSKKTTQTLGQRTVPVMGVTAAFIFAAQMLNFPVAGGTSGHLLGGAIAASLLGPYAGFLVITVVLLVQCFIFQDGGVTALGANVINMALVGTAAVYPIIWLANRLNRGKVGCITGTVVAAWVSVVLASLLCAIELALSGTSPARVVIPAMVGIHAVMGVGEAVVTGFLVAFVLRTRPELMHAYTRPAASRATPAGSPQPPGA
jgi:cobalt/nickel transport system permease protein